MKNAGGPRRSALTASKPLYATASVSIDYDADEMEFLKALEAYRRKHGRPYPSAKEILDLLRSLGWRKVAS